MCRSLAEGGRRCPGGHTSDADAAAIRQRRSRANRALAAAEASGDKAAIAKARQKLAAVDRTPVAARGRVVTSAPTTRAGDASTPPTNAPETLTTAAPKRQTATGKRPARKAPTAAPAGGTAVPEPVAPVAPPAALAPVSGHLLDKPLSENGWGYAPNLPVSYHDDGPIGTAVRYMGADARMDIDGEPLGDVLGKVATDVVMGRRTPQEGLDEYKTIRDRLPEGGRARYELDGAIQKIDAPTQPAPTVPDSAPEPLRRLVTELNAIPLVRKDRKELDVLTELLSDYDAGRTGGSRMIREVRRLDDYRHESFGDSGKFTIHRAAMRAADELEQIGPRNLYRPKQEDTAVDKPSTAPKNRPRDNPSAPQPATRPATRPTPPDVIRDLPQLTSNEDAERYLTDSGLTVKQLRHVAGELGVVLSPLAKRKADVVRSLARNTVGARQDHLTILGKHAGEYDRKRATSKQTAPAADGASLERRVRQAYTELAGRPGGWVSLTRLRKHLGNPPKDELDAVLSDMSRQPTVYLIPEANQKILTAEDRAAAVYSGGEDKHLISFE
jgi:hypothetical protein